MNCCKASHRFRGGRRTSFGLGAVMTVAVAVALSVVTPAEAANWWTWRSSSANSANGTWYGVNTGAQYNQARVRTYTDQANAEVFTAGVGTSSAPAQVIQTFGGYRTVSAQCRWVTGLVPQGTRYGMVDCALGF